MNALGAARPWFAWAGGAFGVVWALAVVWWGLLEPYVAAAPTELTIPEGTAARIASGDAVFLPSTLSLRSGTVLLVRNRDRVAHVVGPATIPPGATARIAQDGGGSLACTIHASGSLGIAIVPRPPFAATLLPALLAGLPLGLLAAVTSRVVSRLG